MTQIETQLLVNAVIAISRGETVDHAGRPEAEVLWDIVRRNRQPSEDAIACAERLLVDRALRQCNANQREAAEQLGWKQSRLSAWLLRKGRRKTIAAKRRELA